MKSTARQAGSPFRHTMMGAVSRNLHPSGGWQDEPSPPKAFTGLDWGKGVADFADAIRSDRNPRCNGAQARHALEICERVIESSDLGRPVDVVSRFPAPVPVGDVAPWEEV